MAIAPTKFVFSLEVSGHPVAVEAFEPTGCSPGTPAVVLLHGRDGADGFAGDRGYRDLASAIATGGFRVLFPHYFDRTRCLESEGQEGHLDELGKEVERFGLWLEVVGFLMRRPQAGRPPFGLLGYSLGGYLALTAGMTYPGASAVAACYTGVPTPFHGLVANLPPTLLLHGGEDRVVPVSECRAMQKLLRAQRIPHETHVYPEGGHGFVGAEAEDAVARIVAFFRKTMPFRIVSF